MELRSSSTTNYDGEDRSRTNFKATPSTGSESGTSSRSRNRKSGSSSSSGRPASPSGRHVSEKSSFSCSNNEHCSKSNQPSQRDSAALHDSTNGQVMGDPGNSTLASSASAARSRQRDVLLPHSTAVVGLMKFCGFLLILFYFAIPAVIKIYPAVIAEIAFLNHFRWPPFVDLSRPDELGLNFTRSFHLPTTDGVMVGTWHVLPEELGVQYTGTEAESQFVHQLQSGHGVILYLHGNAGTRAGWHRVQLYKLLSKAGFHVVTFDYRGYGDSSGSPSEEGLVEDAVSVFKWLKSHTGSMPVYLWGHSLGSAVATISASRLCGEGADFSGLILEGPFNNFVEAASRHPLSAPFRVMPWFSWVFIEAIKYNNLQFASDQNIKGVKVPVVILHALDDGIVPYELGRKLYEVAMRNCDDVKLVTFGADHGYGHKHIHKSPDLIPVIRKFISDHNGTKKL